MTTEKNQPKFHWSKIPSVKFQYKPSIVMLRGAEEIEINQARRKSETENLIVALFDKNYVIEVCSRFFSNLLLSDISYDEWQGLCETIWLSFYPDHANLAESIPVNVESENVFAEVPKSSTKTKAK